MLDDFREWLSDNLRYVFLGLAVILVIVLGAIATSIIRGTDKKESKPETNTQTNSETELITEAKETEVLVQTEAQTEAQTEPKEDVLEKDMYPKINEIVTVYLNSQKDGDEEEYRRVVANAGDTHMAKLQLMQQSAVDNVEAYHNISCYTKKGLEEGAYFTYIYYETKFINAERMLPALTLVYIRTDETGNLQIHDMSEAEVLNRSETLKSDPEVMALVTKINSEFSEIYESDLAAQEAFNKFRDILLSNDVTIETPVINDGNTSEVGSNSGIQTNKVVTVLSECSVREDSRLDAELLGVVQEGDTITRVQVLDNGWTEVKYGEGVGYIYSEYLSE
jgi:Bacterial SH3 domain.